MRTEETYPLFKLPRYKTSIKANVKGDAVVDGWYSVRLIKDDAGKLVKIKDLAALISQKELVPRDKLLKELRRPLEEHLRFRHKEAKEEFQAGLNVLARRIERLLGIGGS